MPRELNDKQRQLVEENHNLIYGFIKSHNLDTRYDDDWYGVAAIALCEAALTFDETRGIKFSTYAYNVMENDVRTEMKKRRRSMHPSYSLDELLESDSRDTLGDIISERGDFTKGYEIRDVIASEYRRLTDTQKSVVDCILNLDMNQADTARHLGISRQRVGEIYNHFRDNIRDRLSC